MYSWYVCYQTFLPKPDQYNSSFIRPFLDVNQSINSEIKCDDTWLQADKFAIQSRTVQTSSNLAAQYKQFYSYGTIPSEFLIFFSSTVPVYRTQPTLHIFLNIFPHTHGERMFLEFYFFPPLKKPFKEILLSTVLHVQD